MIVEMLLLALIAVAVFAYVLAPLVFTGRDRVIQRVEDASLVDEEDEATEAVIPENQPVRDLS